ncbi:MAG TPA: hypothetical protein VK534_01305 [Methylomirabilota bacterium]|nr:hypothetical protein [Methylomirabilota bacterium]
MEIKQESLVFNPLDEKDHATIAAVRSGIWMAEIRDEVTVDELLLKERLRSPDSAHSTFKMSVSDAEVAIAAIERRTDFETSIFAHKEVDPRLQMAMDALSEIRSFARQADCLVEQRAA